MSRVRAYSALPKERPNLRPFAGLGDKMEEEGVENSVEEVSIASGGGLRRFNGLDDLLSTRPAKEDLVNRNILKAEPVAGPIASVQEQLKKSMVEDNLKNKLAARPALNELVEQNILKGTGEDGLNAAKEQEQKLLTTKESLQRALSGRKTEAELVQKNILARP